MYNNRQNVLEIWNEKRPMKNEKDPTAAFSLPVKYFHQFLLKKLVSYMWALFYHSEDEKV